MKYEKSRQRRQNIMLQQNSGNKGLLDIATSHPHPSTQTALLPCVFILLTDQNWLLSIRPYTDRSSGKHRKREQRRKNFKRENHLFSACVHHILGCGWRRFLAIFRGRGRHFPLLPLIHIRSLARHSLKLKLIKLKTLKPDSKTCANISYLRLLTQNKPS